MTDVVHGIWKHPIGYKKYIYNIETSNEMSTFSQASNTFANLVLNVRIVRVSVRACVCWHAIN